MNYGCGDDDCLACYPLVYRCEHGFDFPEPIPNGMPEPACEDLHEDGEEWLHRFFEYEFCSECGSDAEDHELWVILHNWFAHCLKTPAEV